jgi:hypothetical protein
VEKYNNFNILHDSNQTRNDKQCVGESLEIDFLGIIGTYFKVDDHLDSK